MSEWLASSPEAAPAQVACPACGTRLPSYDPAHSRYFGCPQCGLYYTADPLANRPAQRLADLGPPAVGASLRLGQVGELGGYRLRVTGIQLRSELKDATARWREYQLRPVTTLIAEPADLPLQLAEYQGHWLLIRRAPTFPVHRNHRPFKADSFTDFSSRRPYRIWHRYTPQVVDLVGEFDLNVADDEQLAVQEYTSPPYLLVSEQPPGAKQTWYQAEYLEPATVAAAFGLGVADLPARIGVGSAQPAPAEQAWRGLGWLSLLALLGLVAVQVALVALHPATKVLDQSFPLPDPVAYRDTLVGRQFKAERRAWYDSLVREAREPNRPPRAMRQLMELAQLEYNRGGLNARYAAASTAPVPERMLVSRTFTLPARAALSLHLETPGLDNSWVEVTASLVNEQTGRGYEATRSLEYYSGYEGGESWNEGDRAADFVFAAVPAGRYHLNLYPSPDPEHTAPPLLQVQVESQPLLWSNFWLLVLALGVVPLLLWIRRYYFEQERWSQSDYGPSSSA